MISWSLTFPDTPFLSPLSPRGLYYLTLTPHRCPRLSMAIIFHLSSLHSHVGSSLACPSPLQGSPAQAASAHLASLAPWWVQANGGTSRSSAGEKKEKSPWAFPPPHSLPACRGPTFLPSAPWAMMSAAGCPCLHAATQAQSRNSQSAFLSWVLWVSGPHSLLPLHPGAAGLGIQPHCAAVLVPIAMPIPLKKSPFTQFSPKFSGAPIFSG